MTQAVSSVLANPVVPSQFLLNSVGASGTTSYASNYSFNSAKNIIANNNSGLDFNKFSVWDWIGFTGAVVGATFLSVLGYKSYKGYQIYKALKENNSLKKLNCDSLWLLVGQDKERHLILGLKVKNGEIGFFGNLRKFLKLGSFKPGKNEELPDFKAFLKFCKEYTLNEERSDGLNGGSADIAPIKEVLKPFGQMENFALMKQGWLVKPK